MRVAVTLPIRLVSEANSHTHWRERQKRAKEQRLAAEMSLRAAVRNMRGRLVLNPWIPTILVVTITRIAPRALDSDNAVGSAKHIRDGVADALGVNDRDPRVEWVVRQRKSDGHAMPSVPAYAVEIVIEAAKPTEAT